MFNFDIIYIEGKSNHIPDALLRIYSNEPIGVVQSKSEYVTEPDDLLNKDFLLEFFHSKMLKSTPLYTAAIDAELAAYAADVVDEIDAEEPEYPEKLVIRLQRPTKKVQIEEETSEASDEGKDEMDIHPEPPRGADEVIKYTPETILEGAKESDNRRHCGAGSTEDNHNDISNTPADDILLNTALSLTYVISESEPDIQLPEALRHHYSEDPFFSKMIDNLKASKHFIVCDGYIFLKESGQEILCIPDLKLGEWHI
jgi:hypothetical protein